MSETPPTPPGGEPPRQPGERREPRFDASSELAGIYRDRAMSSDTALASEKSARADLERKLAEAETAAAARVKEAEARGNERIIRAELKAHAAALGVVDLDVLKLVDLKAAGVKLGDDGEVTGAKEAIEALKTAKPWAFTQTAAEKGNSSSPATPPGSPPAGAKMAKDMSPEEYKAARAALLGRR